MKVCNHRGHGEHREWSCEQVMVIASGENYLGPQSQLRMGPDILDRFTRHLFLASIGQELGRIFQRDPLGAPDFDPHLVADVVDFSRFVAQQVEADDLEYALAIAPGAYID